MADSRWRIAGQLLAGVVMLALIGCGGPAAPGVVSGSSPLVGPCGPALTYEDYSWSPDGRRILFTLGDSTLGKHIYVMNANGTGLTSLTPTSNNSHSASWSPDGRQIVFVSSRGAVGYQVYTMDADGSQPVPLLDARDNGFDPQWSPDGKRILYKSYELQEGTSTLLMVMSPDGSGKTRLVSDSGIRGSVSWSPPGAAGDGVRIAFVRMRPGNLDEIDLADIASGSLTTLASLGAVNVSLAPAWSGEQILYQNDDMGGIYLIDASGAGGPRLLAGSSKEHMPSWSPDGKSILYEAWTGGTHFELYTMNADGSHQTRLTTGSANNIDGVWSPGTAGAGSRIVFTSERDGAPDLYVMDADGSHQTRLTTNPAAQKCLVWPF